jgi:hypothetical protein
MKRERCMCFSEVVLSQGFLGDSNKINCAAPFSEYLVLKRVFGLIAFV